jgi:hypothetical protein
MNGSNLNGSGARSGVPDTPIPDFERRVASLRIAHGPGCRDLARTALADLTQAQRDRVVNEAVCRARRAKVAMEIQHGVRPDHEAFLNDFAAALLRLPDQDRGRRLRRCPRVLREHVMPLIGEYQIDARRFLIGAGLADPETIPLS